MSARPSPFSSPRLVGFSPGSFLRWVFVALLVLIGVSIAASLIAFAFRGTWTPFFFPFYGFAWVFVFVFFLFFLGARWWGPWGWYAGWHWYPAGDRAKAILRERYARGEIGKDQLDQMMRDLDQRP